jgi:NADPH-dependent curcumin reductase CurA
MTDSENLCVQLASVPTGVPRERDFEIVRMPVPDPAQGQFQIRHLYLALSPSARIRMSGDSDYGRGIAPGEAIPGQTVGVVTRSRHGEFKAGDIVVTNGGWQTHSLSSGRTALRVDTSKVSPKDSLGLLGTSGLTAYAGLVALGNVQPGKVLVVSAASGSVGSVAGQIGKIAGCRVVGITGGEAKCRYVVDELGFDAAVDHRAVDFTATLARACPEGIDIYFENVGGAVRDAVWPLMRDFGRVVLCGMIADYGDVAATAGPSWFPILSRRLTVAGFLLRDHLARENEFRTKASEWIAQGKLHMRYDITDGIAAAPAAFARLLSGQNFGKSLVRISP